jgi:ornithine decarboxylase antizyme 1
VLPNSRTFLTTLQNPSGAPDVEPHAAQQTFKVLKPQNLVPTEGSSVGGQLESQQVPVTIAKYQFTISAPYLDPAVVGLVRELVKSQQTARLQVTVQLIEGIQTHWDVTIDKRWMSVDVPAGPLGEGSKQSLISLLELAEAVGCQRCVVCLQKDRRDRSVIVKTFLFLGFTPMPPSEWPSANPPATQFFMAYNIE